MNSKLQNLAYLVVALAAGFGAYCAASSEVGASNAVRAPSEWIKIPLACAVVIAVYWALTFGLEAIQQIPVAKRPLVWVALLGWTTACLLAAFIVSLFHALYLKHGPQHLLTPGDWIFTRALIGGLYLAFLPAAAIVQCVRDRKTQSVA